MMTLLLILLLQSTVLLALGFLALHLTRKRGPAVQTVLGRAALSSVALLALLLPLSGRVASVWRLPVVPPRPNSGEQPPRPNSGELERRWGAACRAFQTCRAR